MRRGCERQRVIRTGRRGLQMAGIALLVAGGVVLLLSIPAWAWAALLGMLLTAAGLILLCLGRR